MAPEARKAKAAAPSRNPGDRQDVYRSRPCKKKRSRTRLHGGAGGEHIVHQQQSLVDETSRKTGAVDPRGVSAPRCRAQPCLRRPRGNLYQSSAAGFVGSLGNGSTQELSLVEAALSPSLPVKRNRNDRLAHVELTGADPAIEREPPECRRQPGSTPELQGTERLFQPFFIPPHGAGPTKPSPSPLTAGSTDSRRNGAFVRQAAAAAIGWSNEGHRPPARLANRAGQGPFEGRFADDAVGGKTKRDQAAQDIIQAPGHRAKS